MKRLMVVLCLAAAVVAGCSIVMPADREVLHGHFLNAVAVNAKVQAIETPTPEEWAACKAWWNAEAETWTWVDDWTRGVKPQVDTAGNAVTQ